MKKTILLLAALFLIVLGEAHAEQKETELSAQTWSHAASAGYGPTDWDNPISSAKLLEQARDNLDRTDANYVDSLRGPVAGE